MPTSQHELAENLAPPERTAERLSRLLVELAAPASLPGADTWEEPLRPGDRLDRFEIRAVLGRGGFGAVYEAWDAELKRVVALKTLRPARARSAGAGASLKQEAEAVAKLNHPGIVTLHDICPSARGYCLVMERLEGATLAERLRHGPLPWREAVRIGAAMAEALAHAHARGVLHRDLKPANVFVCESGRVKLLDFGLAHLLGTGTGSGSGGTPGYMAPEQARGDPVDARADVFALGVVLAEMITGAVPGLYEGERGLRADVPPPALAPAPARLARLIRRMAAQDPAVRPADGAAAAAELASFTRSLDRLRKGAWAFGAVLACVAAAVIALALQPPRLRAGRLVAAMADLDNQTGDARLDGVGALFGAALEQSRRVSLMDRGTVLRTLTKGGASPAAISEADAVAAARTSSAELVLVPALRPVGGGYELAVQVLDLVRGRTIFTAREGAASEGSIYTAADRLAVRVRRALAEEASEAPRNPAPVAAYAPANADALRLHMEGERLQAEYDYEGAKAKWLEAIALDPSFPLPRLALLQGIVGAFVYLELDEKAAREQARALRRDLARLPEGLRPWAETLVVKVEGGYPNHTEFLAALDEAIAARPEQPAPYIVAANELLLRRGDAEGARPYVDRAVELSPLAGLGDVVDYLVLTERFDEALGLARKWTETAPAPISFANLALVHAARGELEQALSVRRALEQRWTGAGVFVGTEVDAGLFEELDAALDLSPPSPDFLRFLDAELLALRGRVREALRVLDDAPPASGDPRSLGDVPRTRAAVLLARGDLEAIDRAVDDTFLVAGPQPVLAWILAEAGNVALARSVARLAPDRLIGYRMARAIHDWKAGDREGALAELAAITSPASHLYRGQILAEQGKHRDAVEAFRRYRRLRHGEFSTPSARLTHWLLPRSLYLEAASLEALGERDEARRVITSLLRLWARADPDLPLLAKAKELEQRTRAPGVEVR